jgi:hypothetical protein
VLGAEHMSLMDEPLAPTWLEIRCWFSATQGNLVMIETPLALVEQVLILDPSDWLPFLSAHLTPLLTAVAQTETAHQVERLTNAVISWARQEIPQK